MLLGHVMDELAQRLDAQISELNVFAYPPDRVNPPAAILSYPDSITYDETYRRGMDRMILPLVLVVGKVSDASTRDALGAYCDGSGARSIKTVLESGTYTSFDLVVATGVTFDVVTIAATDYMAALFNLDIAGSGA